MKFTLIWLFCTVLSLAAEERPNILLICVDDLRPELKSFGVDYIHSPHIDSLAESGVAFHRHYVNAPTCGASRFSLLTGRYGPADNQALFKRAALMAKKQKGVDPSMPEWFRSHGYTTVAVGKVSHHPGGLGGKNWDNKGALEMPEAWKQQLMPCGDWKHPRGAMHSLANGEIRAGRSYTENKIDALQSHPGPDTTYNDGLITDEGEKQLERLAKSKKPFFLAVGLIKPHLPFGAPKSYMAHYEGVDLPAIATPKKPKGLSTWHDSKEFFQQYIHHGKDPRKDSSYADKVRRHYAACVSYADKQIGDILAKLKKVGKDKNTIVVLWGDHGWHLGEHAIWGKHSLYEESLRAPLIISAPGMDSNGQKTDAVVETVDLYPTLCELVGLPIPEFTDGRSLLPQIKDTKKAGHSALSYTRSATTLRTDSHRLIVHKNGSVELYDHTSSKKETLNIARSNSNLVLKLAKRLHQKSEQKLSKGLLEKTTKKIQR